MTPEEARAVAKIMADFNCCGVEAWLMAGAMAERFPEFPWIEWHREEFG